MTKEIERWINGIGKKIEIELNKIGILTLEQLIKCNPNEVCKIKGISYCNICNFIKQAKEQI